LSDELIIEHLNTLLAFKMSFSMCFNEKTDNSGCEEVSDKKGFVGTEM
jgi:hypothetical protein